MPDWIKELFSYGVLGMIAAGVAWTTWFKIIPWGERYIICTESLCSTLKTNSESQSKSIDEMKGVLIGHDQHAATRSECVAKLLELHTNPALPGSSAAAIAAVHELRACVVETCKFGRALANGDQSQVVKMVNDHCDKLERILKVTV